MESLAQPLFIIGVEKGERYKFLLVNDSFLKSLEINESEVIGHYIRDFVAPDDVDTVVQRYREAITEGKTVQWEENFQYKTGQKTVIVTVSPIYGTNGSCTHLIGLVHDLTEQKKVEELLLENDRYLDNIINSLGDPLFVKDEYSRIILANDAFCSIFQLSKADIMGKTLAEDVPVEERESFLSIDKEVIRTGIENVNEESLTVRNGSSRIISTKKTRFIDDHGRKFLVGIIRDITDRKRAEEEVQVAREYADSLIDSMHEGLVVFDMDTKITRVNASFCRLSGFKEGDLLGTFCPYPFIPPEKEEEAQSRHDQIALGNELSNFESVFMRQDGSRFNVDVMVSSIKHTDGTINAYFATVIDTTERKKAEMDLKLAKEFTDKLVMSMQEGLIIVNPSGMIIQVNTAACRILGYEMDELVGMEMPYPFAKPEDLAQMAQIDQKLPVGELPSFLFEFVRKNGEVFTATFLTGNITNDQGDVIAMFGTMKDISEEIRAKNVLRDTAEKSKRKKEVILELAGLVGKKLESSLDKITKLSAETLQVERVGVWKFLGNQEEIQCEKLYVSSTDAYVEGGRLLRNDHNLYFEAMIQERTLLIDDALKHPATRSFTEHYLRPNHIKSIMDVSITGTNGLYGVLCFEHVGAAIRKWTTDEQEFATSIANIVALMVESTERKSAEQRLIEANQALSLLKEQLEEENMYLRNELDLAFNFEEMIYGSTEFSNVLTEIEQVAPTNATVLLEGESGTGKELLARAIHKLSSRNNEPLIKVNCSAIPRELIESELFGHRKGSFTGAINDKIGKFELADGGTLFLDEIGEIPLDMQPKLLRFLQEGEIEVIGSGESKKLDVRIVAATNRNLKEETEAKRFREDLYFRLHVFPIRVPPLRERKDDIPLLVEHFVDKFNKEYAKAIKFIPDESMEKMKAYGWPGNIRELENLIERASILTTNETLFIPGFESESQKSKITLGQSSYALDAVQRNHILNILERCKWKISGPGSASELLELKPSTLRDRMSKLGIQRKI